MIKFQLNPNKIKGLGYLINCIKEKENEVKLPKYCFLLGAGCSASAGVPIGSEIIDLLKKFSFIKENENAYDLHEKNLTEINAFIVKHQSDFTEYVKVKEKQFKQRIDQEQKHYLTLLPLNIKEALKLSPKTSTPKWDEYKEYFYNDCLYGNWFEEYSEDPRERQQFVEKLIENAEPQGAYILFANVVKKSYIRNIFTTNFDDLINEALLKYVDIKSKVYAHNETAKYISITSQKPNIIKLHGDYLFENIKNINQETSDLEENLKIKFEEMLNRFGLIVVGYAGADYSIMTVLETLKKQVPFSLMWCTNDINRLNWRVINLINSTKNSYVIKIEDFDSLIFKIWNSYNCQVEKLSEKGIEQDKLINRYLQMFDKQKIQSSQNINDKEKQVLSSTLSADHFFVQAFSCKDPNKALRLYSKAIKINPQFSAAYNNRANAYMDLSLPDKAISDYLKAIEFGDKNASNNLAILYSDQGKYTKAIELLNKSLELDPYYFNTYLNLTINYSRLKDYEKALNIINTGIELKPNEPEGYNCRANIYKLMKKYDLALEDIRKAIKLDSDYAIAWATLAEIFGEKGDNQGFYSNIETAFKKGLNVQECHFDKTWQKYHKEEKFKKLVDKYSKANKKSSNC